jgi:hypothetical protein
VLCLFGVFALSGVAESVAVVASVLVGEAVIECIASASSSSRFTGGSSSIGLVHISSCRSMIAGGPGTNKPLSKPHLSRMQEAINDQGPHRVLDCRNQSGRRSRGPAQRSRVTNKQIGTFGISTKKRQQGCHSVTQQDRFHSNYKQQVDVDGVTCAQLRLLRVFLSQQISCRAE